MLKITGDGRKAALDMRLVGAGRRDRSRHQDQPAPSSRIYRTLGGNARTSAPPSSSSATSRRRIPTDSTSTTKSATSSLQHGIPAKEIAFIHDADTDAQKKTLFDAVNAGRVRILLGSTEKMGAGTNVQKRLKALHHLDAPWRPRDIEQREGRILRQGNEQRRRSISTATSPKARSTPICGRRWRPRPASSSR